MHTSARLLLSALFLSGTATYGAVTVRSTTGRSVFQRGETIELAVEWGGLAAAVTRLDIRAGSGEARTLLGRDAEPGDGPTATYRIATGGLMPGAYTLDVQAFTGEEPLGQSSLAFELTDPDQPTAFVIHHIGMPNWVLPAGDLAAGLRAYHFNYSLANLADSWQRGGSGLALTGGEKGAEELVRHNIRFLKYPTVFGWGLAHRPIRGGASWFDPAIRDISAQLTQYHTQACRRFPNFVGLNPIDEPGVSWSDPHMAAAFQQRTGLAAPAEDERGDRARYLAFQTFRNYALQDFHAEMKPYMTEVAPRAVLSCQTFADILTGGGLYPSGNAFMDVQSTHIYDHWPTSNNWMTFAVNLRRANRPVFWERPLYVVTGCYGIMPDQWRAAWGLGMSEKLDGHGYFLGAGELPEAQPWAEFNLAEMIRINRLNERYGDFFLSLRKPVEPLALWYSLAQAAVAPPEEQYEQQVVAAWYGLKRSHFPATVVVDEDIRAGLLAEHRVLLVVGASHIPEDLAARLDAFRRAGGVILADRATTVELPGMRRMDADFREFAQVQQEVGRAWREERMPVSMLLRRDGFAEASVIRQLGAIVTALAPFVRRPATADSPDIFLAVQESGAARYVFVANESAVFLHPNEKERWITMQESVAATARLKLPVLHGMDIRDLWTGERIALDEADEAVLRLPPAGLRVLCGFPRALPELRLGGEFAAHPDGGVVRMTAAADAWRARSGVVPAELQLRTPQNRLAFRRCVSVDLARPNTWEYAVPRNAPVGEWRASLTSLLTGRRAESVIPVQPSRSAAGLAARLPTVQLHDAAQYAAFARRRPLWVVADEPQAGPAAALLAEALGVEVRTTAEVRRPDTYPELLDPEKNKGVWMMPRWEPLSFTVGADVIVVGRPARDALAGDLNRSGVLPRVADSAVLGGGQALVQYAWSPFDRDRDAVWIAGFSEAALLAGAQAFMGAIRGEGAADEAGRVLAGAGDFAAAGGGAAADDPWEVVEPDCVVHLDDGVRKLAHGGKLLAAGTMDGRLHVFDDEGVEQWRREFDYRVVGAAVSPDGAYVAAAAFPRTYVYDSRGQLLFLRSEPVPSRQDIEGLAVAAGDVRLVKGSWQGDVEAVNPSGGRGFVFPAPVAKAEGDDTSPPPPAALGAVRVIRELEGGGFAVGGMERLAVVSAEGQEEWTAPVERLQDVVRAGDRILAASFKRKLVVFDRKGHKQWEAAAPDFVMAVDSTADGGLLAAALFERGVLLLDGQCRVVRRLRLPTEDTLTGIALAADGAHVWVSTWSGRLCRLPLRPHP